MLAAGLVSAYPQMCGRWTVSVELVDGSDRPVENATVSFIEVPEGEAATKRPIQRSEAAQNIFVATFIEGDKVSKEYKLLIVADGFVGHSTTTRIDYCRKTWEKIVLERPLPQPIIEAPKMGIMQYCLTVTDEFGAFIPKASVRFSPPKQSLSKVKYQFMTDENGAINVEVIDGVYEITIKALTFKTMVLKKQLLPYDPRSCVEVRLSPLFHLIILLRYKGTK
jgi:hypothetical protein